MNAQSLEISVTRPLGQAIDHVKLVLFRPFDLGKWFVIGFCAWLAQLGEHGFGGNFNFGSGRGGGGNARHAIAEAREFVMGNLHWIIPLAVTLAIIFLTLWFLFTWLNSRGKFMFLHCVALNKAEVVVPWQKFARQGNSLFLFSLLLALISAILILPLIAVIVLLVIGMIHHGEPSAGGILGIIGTFFMLIALGIVFALIGKFTKDFVVPLMFLRGIGWRKAWGEFWRLLAGNLGHFILYILFQIVLALAIGVGLVLIVLATCCIAGCFLAIPYLGTVLLLPLLIFSRAYSLYYLAQFGREYDVFPSPATAT